MNREFDYPAYGPDGVQVLTTVDGPYADALMDTSVCHLGAGEEKRFFFPNDECAFLLIEGEVTFAWGGKRAAGKRTGCFDDGAEACALHVPRNTAVTLKAAVTSEVFVVSTENERDFHARFYATEDIRNVTSCAGICGGTCERKVTTVFDDVTAPYSNLAGRDVPAPWQVVRLSAP